MNGAVGTLPQPSRLDAEPVGMLAPPMGVRAASTRPANHGRVILTPRRGKRHPLARRASAALASEPQLQRRQRLTWPDAVAVALEGARALVAVDVEA